MGITTAGFHRISSVTARVPYSVGLQVVPGATILVTATATGTEATIYSDPGMSIQIPGALLFADQDGAYDYYAPLNYCMTEIVSAPNGGVVITTNIVQNGPIVGSLTTTAAASDVVSIAGILSTSHVSLTATNSAAAGMIASTYVSAKTAGSITITHPVSAGATFDLLITPY